MLPYADHGSATVFEHLRQAMQFSIDHTGRNGLVQGLQADWNDCMKFGTTGESVFSTFLLANGLRIVEELAEQTGSRGRRRLGAAVLESLAPVIEGAWDGAWFVRGISATGRQARLRRARRGLDLPGVERVGGDLGVVPTRRSARWTPFASGSLRARRGAVRPGTHRGGAGRRAVAAGVSRWAQGERRHLLPLELVDHRRRGRRSAAGSRVRLLPFLPAGAVQRLGRGAPGRAVRVLPVHARARVPRFGQARNSWLTGTASWSYIGVTQYILGVRPELDGLRIDPCLPEGWEGFQVTRRFRGMELTINVVNPLGVATGVARVMIGKREVDLAGDARRGALGSGRGAQRWRGADRDDGLVGQKGHIRANLVKITSPLVYGREST